MVMETDASPKIFLPFETIVLEGGTSQGSTEILEYEKHGLEPQAMFVTRIHGDEGEIGEVLPEVVDNLAAENPADLGEYVAVYNANPEAVAAGTREFEGVDLNREFRIAHITNTRAKLLEEVLLANPSLKYIFSFHEDPEGEIEIVDKWGKRVTLPVDFYMYDTPLWATVNTDAVPDDNEDGLINKLKRELMINLKKAGFRVYTGIDDIKDKALGHFAEDGYIHYPADTDPDGSFEYYAAYLGSIGKTETKRSFTFDIPAKLSREQKIKMTEIIFRSFITPLLRVKNKNLGC
jgi:hypothetical protein